MKLSELIAKAQEIHGKNWSDVEVYATDHNDFGPVHSIEMTTIHRSTDDGDKDVKVLMIRY